MAQALTRDFLEITRIIFILKFYNISKKNPILLKIKCFFSIKSHNMGGKMQKWMVAGSNS